MTARRGTKNPALLVQTKPVETEGGTILVTGRPLRVGVNLLPIGVEVPGAEHFTRLDAWISTRYIKRIGANEEYVKYDDFIAQLEAEKVEEEPVGVAESAEESQQSKE